eukprot:c12756_g1_i2.p1 GENE.c12756_g1_i2~~c12756_g1_i2.p1  ORF type:complete len:906 (-),score=241.60 c12756_g1_i2:27-2744(-)
MSNRKDKDDDFNPFSGLDKWNVLSDCRMFSDRDINVQKCCSLITKIFYLLGQGERITKDNATNVFFGATKLLQSKDPMLRRLVLLVFREMSAIVSPEERIIVTATLVNGMEDKNEVYRANCIRVLSRIIDPVMVSGEIERKLRESVLDASDMVSSAALVAGMTLQRRNASSEVVKRWVNEIANALNSRGPMVQYHSLSLFWIIRKYDRLGLSKLVSQIIRVQIKSPVAQCVRLRMVGKIMEDTRDPDRQLYDFIEGHLRRKSDLVILEAARIICSLHYLTQAEIQPALTTLQLFLTTPKNATKFAALRTLNKVAMTHPVAVQPCNWELEGLMTNANRSIATLAITTLLKTATDANVDRLMKQVGTFMTEIADEFKVVVVEAMRSLCLKFPQKHRLFMGFLSGVLREEGGYDYKRIIVDTICDIIQQIPEGKEAGLAHLCEFIEDCEFTKLNVKVLNLLGREAVNTRQPQRTIRFVYNRIVLENATVRSAAVDSLAAFGRGVPALRASVITLLTRCAYDTEDEVRDRASLHLTSLTHQHTNPDTPDENHPLAALFNPLTSDLDQLEAALSCHVAQNTDEPFDLAGAELTIARNAKPPPPSARTSTNATGPSNNNNNNNSNSASPLGTHSSDPISPDDIDAVLLAVPAFAALSLGPRFRSTRATEVTEGDSDYVVACVKHIFSRHLILEFQITNTVGSLQLEGAEVEGDLAGADGLELVASVPAEKLLPNVLGSCYLVYALSPANLSGSIVCTLKFQTTEIDPSSGEVCGPSLEDEYELEEVAVATRDLIQPFPITDFRAAWMAMGETVGSTEKIEMFALSYNKITAALSAIIQLLGLAPCEGTQRIKDADTARKHTLLAAGLYLGGTQTLCITNFALDQSGQQVHIRVCLRSASEQVNAAVMKCVG